MNKLRDLLRGWLGVKDEPTEGINEEALAARVGAEAIEYVDRHIYQMVPYACINDGKLMISNKDPIYTNSEGKKFCSHECIDKYKDEKDEVA